MTTIESPLCCARPGPQVPDAMPISIARQVRKWQVRESEVRECVLVVYKRGQLAREIGSHGRTSTMYLVRHPWQYPKAISQPQLASTQR
jgi:predicted DNA-binding transcriptional regulator